MKVMRLIAVLAMLAIAYSSLPAVGQAGNDPGRREYMSNCAVCHGVDGRGNGPLRATGFLEREPADLTTLASANGGEFPFERVYQAIDGRQATARHESRDMPIWGREYYTEGVSTGASGVLNPEAYVRTHILGLIDYLARVQAAR